MFESAVRTLLGGWGNVVLDFYLEYQLYVNLVILTAGVVAMIIRRRKKQQNEAAQESKEQ